MFATVNLPLLDKEQAAREILAIPDDKSFWDSYRYTKMIPLMTKGGIGSRFGASNERDDEFKWTEHTPLCISQWFESAVFPWINTPARVMALITMPGVSNYEHIDCNPDELATLQHKFRIVVQGRTDTLYFKTTDGDKYVPNVDKPFIMDGSWPHGMENFTKEIKVTLALGAPWAGKKEYNDIDVLMDNTLYQIPEDLSSFWKK